MVEDKEQLAEVPLEDRPEESSQEKESPDAESELSQVKEELQAEKARSEDYFRRLQYLQADFENYRKRVEKEMSETKRFGNERVLSDLLLVNDELELALRKAEEKNQNPVLLEGVEMVHKRLWGLLSKEGVERIQSLGSRFTPDLHEAALRVPSDKEEGTVVEEIRTGYLLKGRVLRPSIVKVAEKQDKMETQTGEDEKE